MKRQVVFLLSILFVFGAAPFQRGLSQRKPAIEIKVGKQRISLPEAMVQKAKEAAKAKQSAKPITPLASHSQDKSRKPANQPVKDKKPAENVAADKKTSTDEGVAADSAAPSRKDVESLVKEFKLDEKTKENPHLAFGKAEIDDWYRQKRSEEDLRSEFAARQVVLEAADKQRVPIKDQDTLSRASREVILIIRADSPIQSTNPAQTSKPTEPKKEPVKQEPDLPNIICEGDTSQEKIAKAWAGLNAHKGAMNDKNLEQALVCTMSAIEKWQGQADEQQANRQKAGECRTTPSVSQKDAYFASYWALADIGAAWFIRGQALVQQRKWQEAREAYRVVIDRYSCAYAWDPRGWFWRIADGAQEQYNNIQNR